MHRYGTTREHFAEVAISTRANAVRRESALMREPLTLDDYFGARMISTLCLYDGLSSATGRSPWSPPASSGRGPPPPAGPGIRVGQRRRGRWGQAITWLGMPDEYFAPSGHRTLARRLYEMAGVGPHDVDVALIYDHFSPMVILQLEDYGIALIGEGGLFVADGNIRWPDGSVPVNTHGGNLSEAYIIGMTHVKEGVEQMRGTAVNQVEGAEVALVTEARRPCRRARSSSGQQRDALDDQDPGLRGRGTQGAKGEGRSSPELIRLAPNVWTEPYWDMAHEHRGRAPLHGVGTHRMPPSPFCHVCRRQEVEWDEHDGRGTIYTFTVVRHGVIPGLEDALPLIAVVALDGLDEIRLVGDVVGAEPEDVEVGAAVEVEVRRAG